MLVLSKCLFFIQKPIDIKVALSKFQKSLEKYETLLKKLKEKISDEHSEQDSVEYKARRQEVCVLISRSY